MTRPKLLFSCIVLLGLTWLGIWIYDGWGTITLDYENKPLSTVLRSFTRQSNLKVVTDLDLSKPTSIHVHRVPVTEALDALQASAESRGRLAALFAPDAPSLKNLIASLPTPPDNSGIISIEYRTPWLFRGGMDGLPVERDPRNQQWKPTPQVSTVLISSLEQAAQTTEVRIFLPQSWNPALKKAPQSGPISSSLPSLAHNAGGQAELVYLLPARSEGDGPGGPSAANESAHGNLRWRDTSPLPPEALLARLESRISALPSSEQADARQAAEESVRQYREWSSLTTEEERDKKRQEVMNDPARAEKAGEGFSRAMRKMSPEQRSQRYKGYVARRSSQKGG